MAEIAFHYPWYARLAEWARMTWTRLYRNKDRCVWCREIRPIDAQSKGWEWATYSDAGACWMCPDCQLNSAEGREW